MRSIEWAKAHAGELEKHPGFPTDIWSRIFQSYTKPETVFDWTEENIWEEIRCDLRAGFEYLHVGAEGNAFIMADSINAWLTILEKEPGDFADAGDVLEFFMEVSADAGYYDDSEDIEDDW